MKEKLTFCTIYLTFTHSCLHISLFIGVIYKDIVIGYIRNHLNYILDSYVILNQHFLINDLSNHLRESTHVSEILLYLRTH